MAFSHRKKYTSRKAETGRFERLCVFLMCGTFHTFFNIFPISKIYVHIEGINNTLIVNKQALSITAY